MNDNKTLYVASFCFATSLALVWKWRSNGVKPPLPPGPKGLPLLGNVLDVPKDVPIWQTFSSLAQKFNTDVLYLKLLKTEIIILNSPEAISDLFEKRSNIYSDRPWSSMLELMGHHTWNFGVMGYGRTWRDTRKLLHEFLSARAVTRFNDHQRKHTYQFLLHLAESPHEFLHHTQFFMGALVMGMTYGVDITSAKDRFLQAAVKTIDFANEAWIPGSFLVDIIPMLRYIPEWFPGAGFKTFARVARETSSVAVDEPLEYVKELIKSGEDGNTSIAWSCLGGSPGHENQAFHDNVIRAATATLYLAAADATTSVLHTFFLAMALNPHVVRRAQVELDRVVGDERLPDFSDQENLPYISAIVKEVLRWGCPAPVGLPKRVTEDDRYNGYFIPAGATVAENIWAVLHNESTYPEPHIFNPERYLKDGKLDPSAADPEKSVFGSGRRICPGQYFALRSLFLNFACVLTVFNVEAPTGEKLEAKFFEGGLIRTPIPFKCTIRPRSEASLKLMDSARAAVET